MLIKSSLVRCTWSVIRTVRLQSTSGVFAPQPLRNKKPKSQHDRRLRFVDCCSVRVIGGQGGDGCISFMQLWANENAGPDGGDGGCGGHVIFQANSNTSGLAHLTSIIRGESGEKGFNKDCHGRGADHTVVQVPVGTVVREVDGTVVADLNEEGVLFIAARGGAGGRGNMFFTSDTEQTPQVAEYGAEGESKSFIVELSCMAHIGLIGFPNAGKSTLLRAISRASPRVAPYPFTTLRPHLGVVEYDDYEQVTVADLPGLISGAHQNRGLGIGFLRHAERCRALLLVLDTSQPEPWKQFDILKFELSQFSEDLADRPFALVANKMDLPDAEENLKKLKSKVGIPVIPISAKLGNNLKSLLQFMRQLYDKYNSQC